MSCCSRSALDSQKEMHSSVSFYSYCWGERTGSDFKFRQSNSLGKQNQIILADDI